MAKTKISEFSSTPANNTDIDSINIAEGCAPSGINDAIRELMAQLKDFQTGAAGDSFNGPVGTTTAAAGAFTTLAASGVVTLSGGTANGVAYLNGSKVLTTGSALVFDGSNLGLGVTPSAWGSGYKSLDIFSSVGGYVASGNYTISIGQNTYQNSSGQWIYKGSSFAPSRFDQFNGAFTWYTAPSGTAGNAISFTQAMTLDASGNLLVGQTSARDPGGTRSFAITGTGVAASLDLTCTSTGGRSYAIYTSGSSNNGLQFYDLTANAERARIDSSGNLLVPGIYNLTTGAGANVHVASDGTLYRSTSSLKYKTDVQDTTHGLAQVMQLRPVTYKGKNDGDVVFGGLIAEEVHEAGLTEFVQYAEDGTPDALAYANMVSLAFKAIQEQQAIINQLKARLDAANL